jgi:hypothetical protein
MTWSPPSGIWAALALLLSLTLYITLSPRKSPHAHLPLPPSPPRLPLLGSPSSLPSPSLPEHVHWSSHAALYGPISSISILNTTLIILHDRTVARELLASAPYAAHTAGRPEMVFAGKLCGYEKIVLCRGSDEGLRRGRRMLARELGGREVVRWRGVIEGEVGRMVGRMGRVMLEGKGRRNGGLFEQFQT